MTDHINEQEQTEQSDTRRLAAERLRHVAVLQFRRQRRGPGGEPWRDPRNGQGRVLAVLKLKPEMTQRELTYLMGMSRQSMAELLRKLETQGLIKREPSPDDRRAVTVTLTEAGHNAAQDTDPDTAARLTFLECLTDDEVAQLADYLGRIIERLEQESDDNFKERVQVLQEFRRHHGRGPRGRGGFPGFPAETSHSPGVAGPARASWPARPWRPRPTRRLNLPGWTRRDSVLVQPACTGADNDLSRERSAPSLNGSSGGCTAPSARPIDDRRLAGNPAIGYW